MTISKPSWPGTSWHLDRSRAVFPRAIPTTTPHGSSLCTMVRGSWQRPIGPHSNMSLDPLSRQGCTTESSPHSIVRRPRATPRVPVASDGRERIATQTSVRLATEVSVIPPLSSRSRCSTCWRWVANASGSRTFRCDPSSTIGPTDVVNSAARLIQMDWGHLSRT